MYGRCEGHRTQIGLGSQLASMATQHFCQTSTRKLSRQLWPNTKSGRWRCLCLPNAGPWSCRPPWMPTPLQVGIQHHDGSSWLNAAVTTWAQAVLPLQPQAAGTTGKKLSKLKNQLLFLNLQET
ncbi:uncharacterized protein isoform X11 [Macaca fascicularis]|uniref:uncharacterized protein isoform X11 n=1 Tax=Macaca fascicularis TaxID=9541 RepID=UPI003D15DD8C